MSIPACLRSLKHLVLWRILVKPLDPLIWTILLQFVKRLDLAAVAGYARQTAMNRAATKSNLLVWVPKRAPNRPEEFRR